MYPIRNKKQPVLSEKERQSINEWLRHAQQKQQQKDKDRDRQLGKNWKETCGEIEQ